MFPFAFSLFDHFIREQHYRNLFIETMNEGFNTNEPVISENEKISILFPIRPVVSNVSTFIIDVQAKGSKNRHIGSLSSILRLMLVA